jgi:hypothetical protein
MKSLTSPVAVSEKETVALHTLFGANNAGQLVLTNENPWTVGTLIPRIVMLSSEFGSGLFAKLNVCDLVLATFTVPKLNGAGLTLRNDLTGLRASGSESLSEWQSYVPSASQSA